MALNTLPNEGLTNRGYPSDRIVTPIIINGDMSVCQRTTSTSSVSSGSTFPVDRYKFMPNALGTFTISQSTTVPTGQGFSNSIKVDCTTANASPGDGSTLQLVQYLEGQNLQLLKKGTSSAEAVTISFWVRSNKTGTYTLELYDNDNTRQISQTYTISSADTWEKKIVNFAGDTSGALGNDNGLSFAVQFWLATGANYNNESLQTSWNTVTQAKRVSSSQVNLADSTSNEWYITGLQLEVGEFDSTSIPSFPFESFENNLRKCQRYYYKHMSGNGKNICSGNYYDSGTFYGSVFFPVPMRASPSLEMVSGTDYYRLATANSSNNGLLDDFNVGFIAYAGDGISIGLGVNSGLSGVGGYGATMSGNNSSAELAFGSEL